MLTGSIPLNASASSLDKFIQNFSKAKCVKAEFKQKSYIKLYKIWKTAKGTVYIKRNTGIIYIYSNKKVTGIYKDRLFLFRNGAAPYIKRISREDPIAFLWKNSALSQFDISKKKKGWQFVMKKNPDFRAIVEFNSAGFPIVIKQTDLFGNITDFYFDKQEFKCNFSIKRLFENYLEHSGQ
ncbi:MAG: hypothetical protein IEMM0003_0886 [bacterium]|nr:MAG: hypothetical protein IEMM0003_0886 [bacterium]